MKKSIEFTYFSTFERFSWLGYLGLNIEVYENLVRAFYFNSRQITKPGHVDQFYNDRFSPYLMRQPYEINRSIIAYALDDEEEVEVNSIHFDALYLAQYLFDDESLPSPPLQAAKLNMHDQLLHLIITHVLAPLGTQYSSIRKKDYW